MKALEVVFFAGAPTLVLGLILWGLKKELRDNLGCVALLALATALFFHRILFLGEAISQSDANLLQAQFFSVYREGIAQYGEIPFWNPHIGAGVPNLANPISAMFYPLAPVFLVGGVLGAMGVFIACHYFLAGVFALLLGRRIFEARPAALAFAVLYAFNGWALMRAAHQPAIEYLFAYTWMPLAALAFERAVNGESLLLAIVSCGAALAWMGTACPNMLVYGGLTLGVALAARLISLAALRRVNAAAIGVGVAAGGLVFALLLGAVEWAPAMELAHYSKGGRLGAVAPGGWRGEALTLWQIVKLYSPLTAERPFGVYYSPGIVGLVLALGGLYAAVRFKIHRALAAGALAVLAAGVCLSLKTPLYDLLSRSAGVFGLASLIPASLVMLCLPVAALAGGGVDAVIKRKEKFAGWSGYALAALVFAELFGGFAVAYPQLGDRRLTYKYSAEVADFPHLDLVALQTDPGRILVRAPAEGDVIAPSYALLERGLSRLNVTPGDFPPDAMAETVNAIAADPQPDALTLLGTGWLASTSRVRRLGDATTVDWPGVGAHLEGNVHFAMRRQPGWLAWDRRVRLYRISEAPTIARGEPLTKRSVAQGMSDTPIEELVDKPLEQFSGWTGVTSLQTGLNTVNAIPPEDAPVRYFFAVTAYPGWRAWAGGNDLQSAAAARAFIAVDAPAGAEIVTLRFQPSNWRLWEGLAAAGLVIAAIAAGRAAKCV